MAFRKSNPLNTTHERSAAKPSRTPDSTATGLFHDQPDAGAQQSLSDITHE